MNNHEIAGNYEPEPRYLLTPEHLRPILDEAISTLTDIPEEAARELAGHMRLMEHSPLTRFALGENPRPSDLRHNYLEIYHNPDNPGEVREWAAWIGSYLIHRDNPRPQRQDRTTPIPDLSTMLWATTLDLGSTTLELYVPGNYHPIQFRSAVFRNRMRDFVNHYGPPFRAFLLRNDVAATEPGIGERFADSYVGQFTSREEAIRRLAAPDVLEQVTADTGRSSEICDGDERWRRLTQEYIVIELEGLLHVFSR